MGGLLDLGDCGPQLTNEAVGKIFRPADVGFDRAGCVVPRKPAEAENGLTAESRRVAVGVKVVLQNRRGARGPKRIRMALHHGAQLFPTSKYCGSKNRQNKLLFAGRPHFSRGSRLSLRGMPFETIVNITTQSSYEQRNRSEVHDHPCFPTRWRIQSGKIVTCWVGMLGLR